jgi:hypothetical protein
MNNWIAIFAAALVVVIGFAAGPVTAVICLFAFFISLYLLWALELGFSGAKQRFDFKSFSPPVWKAENFGLYKAIFVDTQKVIKAAAIAVGLTALSLLLPVKLLILGLVAVAVWVVIEIYRADKPTTVRVLDSSKKN